MAELTHPEIVAAVTLATKERDAVAAVVPGHRDRALAERSLRRIGVDPGPFAGAGEMLADREARLASCEREVEELEVAERLIVLRELDRVSIGPIEAKLDEATRELEAFPNSREWGHFYHEQHRRVSLTAEQTAEWGAFLALKNTAINLSNQLAIFCTNRRHIETLLPTGMRQIVASEEWKKSNIASTAAPPAKGKKNAA